MFATLFVCLDIESVVKKDVCSLAITRQTAAAQSQEEQKMIASRKWRKAKSKETTSAAAAAPNYCWLLQALQV